MPAMLAFHFVGERRRLLVALAREMNCRLTEVTPERQGQTLGVLCGLLPPGKNASAAPALREELLVLSGFTGEELDRFLQQWKARADGPIRLKAMLTPANLTWTPEQLCRELKKEAEKLGT